MVNLQTPSFWTGWVATGTLLLAWVLMIPPPQRKLEVVKGVILTVAFFFLGAFLTVQNTDRFNPNHVLHHLTDSTQLVATVNGPPTEKAKSWKVPVKIQSVQADDSAHSVFGKAFIYLEPDSLATTVRYGDQLFLHHPPDTLDPPANPGEFNYKRYLSFHNIYHQGYYPSGTWERIDQNQGHPIYGFIFKLRRHLLGLIDQNVQDPQSKSVAGALLLGYRDGLDKELLTAYASTGAMHVLAVSGLHVGIIFLVLRELTQTLRRRKWSRRWLRPAILLGGIWFFALITGLSPSVSRAATMFSFVIIGQSLDRPVNIYSSLAASAFVLLAVNPYMLTEIGFLLSYAAVLGIVYFQPKFYRLLYVKNYLLDKAWAITCVSLAAQLATFPIGILFFYQFPSYFLISNLVVIPAASVILYTGMLMFLTSIVPPLSMAIGWILNWSIYVLNWMIQQIEVLPGALIQPLSLTIPQTILIYLFIIGMSVFLVRQRIRGLLFGMGMGILFIGSLGWATFDQSKERQAVVYSVSGHTALALIDGQQGYFVADSTMMHSPDKMLFHIYHHWWQAGIQTERLELDSLSDQSYEQIRWNDYQIIIPLAQPTDTVPLIIDTVDLLLVSENTQWSPQEAYKWWSPHQVVLDGSCQYQKRKEWREASDTLGLAIHDVREEGAWISDVP